MPERFTLNVVNRDPSKISDTAHFCYDGKFIASVSWHWQTHVSAFLIYHGRLITYKNLDEAINELVMHTLQLRLRGVI